MRKPKKIQWESKKIQSNPGKSNEKLGNAGKSKENLWKSNLYLFWMTPKSKINSLTPNQYYKGLNNRYDNRLKKLKILA